MKRRGWLPSALLAALSIVACNALVGIEDPIVQDAPSGSCLLNSDCKDATQVCVFQTCSPPCQADRDCTSGARCLGTSQGQACVLSSAATCNTTDQCPTGSICSSGMCRNPCGTGCLPDQECTSEGVCHGTSAHDPTTDSSMGGDSGAAGGSSAVGVGGAGGTGPSTPVCVPGHKRCTELVVETCIDDAWVPSGDCPYACKDGQCQGECLPDSKDCSSLVPRTCTADATWTSSAACPKVCEKGACVDRCTEGTLQCDGKNLMRCGADGMFALDQACTVDCVNQHCTECTPPAQDCKNGVHRTCSQNGTWGTGFNCSFMCVGNDCGVCSPNPQPTECINNTPQYCDATGNFKAASSACNGATPLCLNGKCVACTPNDVECLDSNTPRSCDMNGAWKNGTDCAGATPICLKGACVACTPNDVGCLDANTPRTCTANGTWKNGTDCAGSAPVCLAGSCVACTPNATPTHCASACTKTRQYCSPQGNWVDYATSCTGADSCSNGSCSLAAEQAVGQYAQLPSFIDGLADNLLANRIQITCNSDLLRLGARFKTAAGKVRFALYKDNAGAPGAIVAGTASTDVLVGITEASASSAALAPGFYWVVMNLGDQLAAPYYQDSVAPAPTRYAAYAFSTVSFPPSTFPAFDSLPQLYDLYAIVRADP